MGFEIAALIILLIGLIGMGVIIYRKIPVLAELPETSAQAKENLLVRLKNKVFNISFVKNFSFALFLQKILSKIRILTLRTESKTADWLQKLREKSQKKKNFDNDNYWQELKNSTAEPRESKARREMNTKYSATNQENKKGKRGPGDYMPE